MSKEAQPEMLALTWENYANDVRRFAQKVARDLRFKREDAEDFVMRCSVKVFQKMRENKFRTWGGVIVCIRNEARDFKKELSRDKRKPHEDLAAHEELAVDEIDHESSRLNRDILDMALQTFPLAFAVGVLTTHGMTFDQIAGAFGWTSRRLQIAVSAERRQMEETLESDRFKSSSLLEDL